MASAGFDGHASKRQRTDVEGYGVQLGNRDNFEDPHKPAPSAVIHVRGLAETVTDSDLIEAVQHFGAVSFVMTMPRRRQALIEFEDSTGAQGLVNYAATAPIYVCGQPAFFNYSTSKKIQRPPGAATQGSIENHILLFTVLNPQYPITVDVMHTICSPSGKVLRVVIFKKNGVQVMVEFENTDSARRAKQALNGADIYSGCCTLKIEYAKTSRLNVYRNDSESWDYETPTAAVKQEQARNQPLLADPRFSAGPTLYGEDADVRPPRNGPAGFGQSSMEMDYNSSIRGEGKYDQFGRPTGPGAGGFGGGYQQGPGGYHGGYQDGFGSDPYHNGSGRSLFPPPRGGGPNTGFVEQGPPGSGMGQQGAVLMVYGLTPEKINCKGLFNMFCLYGNVVRVKFLKSKEGAAMIQMGDVDACNRAIQFLSNAVCFENKLQLGRSKQAFLQEVPNPHELPDGSPSAMDFMANRNNRFTNPDAAAKNRIQPPSKILHFFNCPPSISETELTEMFVEIGVTPPSKVKKFPVKGENARSCTGLLEWDTKSGALEALLAGNHHEIPNNQGGRNPFVFKLCFSSTPIAD